MPATLPDIILGIVMAPVLLAAVTAFCFVLAMACLCGAFIGIAVTPLLLMGGIWIITLGWLEQQLHFDQTSFPIIPDEFVLPFFISVLVGMLMVMMVCNNTGQKEVNEKGNNC